MSKKYFLDAINDEALAKMIDTMLRFEKNQKAKKPKINLLKIIPVVAAIILVIGLVNLLPIFMNGFDNNVPGVNLGMLMTNPDDYSSDIEKLKAINPDYYGWIKVSGTNIDYPVVQGEDNDFYLTNDFNKEQHRAGAIFCDYRNDRDVSKNRNTIIYGHNMLDGSMFSALEKNYRNEEIFQNGIIELITENAVYYYKVFSVRETAPASGYIQVDFDSDEKYIEFLYAQKELSLFQNDIIFDENSRIITLSTCVNDYWRDIRFVVQGVLVDVVNTSAEQPSDDYDKNPAKLGDVVIMTQVSNNYLRDWADTGVMKNDVAQFQFLYNEAITPCYIYAFYYRGYVKSVTLDEQTENLDEIQEWLKNTGIVAMAADNPEDAARLRNSKNKSIRYSEIKTFMGDGCMLPDYLPDSKIDGIETIQYYEDFSDINITYTFKGFADYDPEKKINNYIALNITNTNNKSSQILLTNLAVTQNIEINQINGCDVYSSDGYYVWENKGYIYVMYSTFTTHDENIKIIENMK
jgi:sortase B